MPIIINIPDRRTTRSVLWNPRLQNAPPRLVIGRLQAGNPPTLEGIRRIDLRSLQTRSTCSRLPRRIAASTMVSCTNIGLRSTTAGPLIV